MDILDKSGAKGDMVRKSISEFDHNFILFFHMLNCAYFCHASQMKVHHPVTVHLRVVFSFCFSISDSVCFKFYANLKSNINKPSLHYIKKDKKIPIATQPDRRRIAIGISNSYIFLNK